MRLLFFYAAFFEGTEKTRYHGFEEFSLNFSRDYIYEVKDGAIQEAHRPTPIPDYFWEKGIYNVTALVGENASGKTTILQYVATVLTSLGGVASANVERENEKMHSRNKILVQDESTGRKYKIDFLWQNGQARMGSTTFFDWENGKELDQNTVLSRLRAWKLIYHSNTLTSSDWEFTKQVSRYESNENDRSGRRSHYLYNISRASWLAWQHESAENNKPFSAEGQLSQYFLEQQYRQVKFVFDRRQWETLRELRKQGIKVPYAEYVTVRLHPLLEQEEESLSKLFPASYAEMKRTGARNKIELLVWTLCARMALNYIKTAGMLTALREEGGYHVLSQMLEHWASEQRKTDGDQNEFSTLIQKALDFEMSHLSGLWRDSKPQPLYDPQEKEEAEKEEHWSKEFMEFVRQKDSNGHYLLEQYVQPEKIFLRKDWAEGGFPFIESFQVKTDLELEEGEQHPFIKFMRLYRYSCDICYFLDFSWGLSSGETAMLGMFADLYYLYARDYGGRTKLSYAVYNGNVPCDSILLFMDEADMLYHPEWQRTFLAVLTKFLPRLYPEQFCKSIQIILTTHSPLMLGDIPSQNVLYLKQENGVSSVRPGTEQPTFAQNIYLLLKNSFYLEHGAVGEIARTKLNEALAEIQKTKALSKQSTDAEIEEHREQLQRVRKGTLDLLAPGIIKSKLREEIEACEEHLRRIRRSDYQSLSDEELSREVERMQRELERRGQA